MSLYNRIYFIIFILIKKDNKMDPLLIKTIIADFHQRELPRFSPRLFNLDCPENKIRTLVGPRRSGKTFMFFQLIHELLQAGIPKKNILYFNFEDERLLPFRIDHLSSIITSYYEMYPELKAEKVYLFFDEIQNIPNWEIFIRRIYDTENARINLTGSSSRLMSSEIATTLRGRTLAFEIFPFNFKEFLLFKQIPLDFLSSKNRAYIIHAFEEYLFRGGFPEVLGVSEDDRLRILQDYFNVLLYKDLIERFEIRNHALIKYLFKFLLANSANPFSVNKFVNDTRSQGFRVAKDSIHAYLSFIEDSMLFSLVPIFSESIRKRQVNYRKVYPVDHGLVTALVASTLFNTGRLLETIVYNHLRRHFFKDQIFYYRINGKEIDFVIVERGEVKKIIQVCERLNDESTRRREFESLFAAMKALKLKEAYLITRGESGEEKREQMVIRILPFWRWALQAQ